MAVGRQLWHSFRSSGCGRPAIKQPGELYPPGFKRAVLFDFELDSKMDMNQNEFERVSSAAVTSRGLKTTARVIRIVYYKVS